MYTVLIVEDEILVSAGLKSMIQWADMNMTIVGEARNGKQGLEMYHELRPDIILTDIKMPIMDGLEMISQIRKEDTVTKIIVLTCYEDFELVRQAFLLGISDYIPKLSMMPDKIEGIVRKVYDELRSSNVQSKEGTRALERVDEENDIREKCRDYIMLQSCSYEEFQMLAKRLQMTESGLAVCVMGNISDSFPQQQTDTKHINRVEQIILSLIQSFLSKNKWGEIWIEKENRYLMVLSLADICENGKRKAFLHDILGRIRGVLHSRLNMEVQFGISSFADSYSQMNRLYTEAVQALEESALLEEDQVFYGDPENHQKYECIWKEFEEQIASSDSLSDSNYQKIVRELSLLKVKKRMNRDDIKETMIRWIHWSSFDVGIQKEEVMQLAMESVEQMRSAVSLNDMCLITKRCFTAIYHGTDDMKTVSREVAKAISYIKQHCCEEDISLPGVAEEVSIHKNYLSKIFKRETGIGFADYVNMERMKKAQELLANTQMKNYEIAQAVGFQDESYFCRVFKKIVGIRPNEYKRRGMMPEEEVSVRGRE